MIERVQWSLESLHFLQNTESLHFTEDETSEYRRKLMREIEKKITLLGTSMPSNEEQYFGTYHVLVGRHKVYYSLDPPWYGCLYRVTQTHVHAVKLFTLCFFDVTELALVNIYPMVRR